MKLNELMETTEVSTNPFDYVAVNSDGKPITTSIMVADYFEKEHRRVLQDIREAIIPNVPTEFTEHNFVLSSYVDSTGRTLPMCELTRDGFTMVAMGYTGNKAMAFKLAYIKAFNQMEDTLNRKNNNLALRVEVITEHVLNKRMDRLEKLISAEVAKAVKQLR